LINRKKRKKEKGGGRKGLRLEKKKGRKEERGGGELWALTDAVFSPPIPQLPLSQRPDTVSIVGEKKKEGEKYFVSSSRLGAEANVRTEERKKKEKKKREAKENGKGKEGEERAVCAQPSLACSAYSQLRARPSH